MPFQLLGFCLYNNKGLGKRKTNSGRMFYMKHLNIWKYLTEKKTNPFWKTDSLPAWCVLNLCVFCLFLKLIALVLYCFCGCRTLSFINMLFLNLNFRINRVYKTHTHILTNNNKANVCVNHLDYEIWTLSLF